MIVIKHNDTIYVAKSSWGFRDPEARRTGVPDVENLCMWHPGRKKNRLIANNCSSRFTDIIRYEDVFPSQLDPKHLVFETFDKMYALADRFGLCNGDKIPMHAVFAEGDKAYILQSNGEQHELENIHSYTVNDEIVMALYDLKGVSDPYQFFKEAYQTLESLRAYSLFPVMVMNTKNNKIEIINR